MNMRSQKALTTVTQNLPELRCALSDTKHIKSLLYFLYINKDYFKNNFENQLICIASRRSRNTPKKISKKSFTTKRKQ